MKRFFLRCLAAIGFLAGLSPVFAAGDWGKVTASSTGATLENEIMLVEYGKKTFGDGNWTYAIKKFIIKSASTENNAGGDQFDGIWQSANTGTGNLQTCEVKYDGDDKKTVHFKYEHASTDVTIYPNNPVLQIDYLQNILETVDIATPGGGGSCEWVFYGGDKWKRGYVTYEDSYYNAPEKGDPDNAGSLNCSGWFIAGALNKTNKRGYIRIMPVAHISIIKLLPWGGAGFEWFPHYGGNKGGNSPFSGYIMAATNGADDVNVLGPKVVAWINGGENPFGGSPTAVNPVAGKNRMAVTIRQVSPRCAVIQVPFAARRQVRLYGVDGTTALALDIDGAGDHRVSFGGVCDGLYVLSVTSAKGSAQRSVIVAGK